VLQSGKVLVALSASAAVAAGCKPKTADSQVKNLKYYATAEENHCESTPARVDEIRARGATILFKYGQGLPGVDAEGNPRPAINQPETERKLLEVLSMLPDFVVDYLIGRAKNGPDFADKAGETGAPPEKFRIRIVPQIALPSNFDQTSKLDPKLVAGLTLGGTDGYDPQDMQIRIDQIDVLRHEIGHAMQNEYLKAADLKPKEDGGREHENDWEGDNQGLYGWLPQQFRQLDHVELEGMKYYGASNDYEWFAEAFATYYCVGAPKQRMPTEFPITTQTLVRRVFDKYPSPYDKLATNTSFGTSTSTGTPLPPPYQCAGGICPSGSGPSNSAPIGGPNAGGQGGFPNAGPAGSGR
jgi:hypothetical protein